MHAHARPRPASPLLPPRFPSQYPFGSPIGPSYFWRTIEDELSTIGAYYDVSALSLRNAVYQLMAEGRHGFQVQRLPVYLPVWLAVCLSLPRLAISGRARIGSARSRIE